MNEEVEKSPTDKLTRRQREGTSETAAKRVATHFNEELALTGVLIYHYTTIATLSSVVSSGELWMSDATFINDRSELEIGLELVRNQLSIASQAAELESYIEKSNAGHVGALLEGVKSRLETEKRPEVYVCCFSRESDDLPQWRAYGGQGTGVALGLRAGADMFGKNPETLLKPVFYNTDDQKLIIDTVIEEWSRNLEDSLEDDNEDILHVVDSWTRRLWHDLWRYIVSFKQADFRAEREVRYVYLMHDYREFLDSVGLEQPTPRFRERGGLLVPYLTTKTASIVGSV